MWRLFYFFPIWILWYVLVELPLTLLGIPLVAWHIYRNNFEYRQSQIFPDRSVLSWKNKLMWLFGNEEDGVNGLPLDKGTVNIMKRQCWWKCRTKAWSSFKLMFTWAALRNSVSNLRYSRLGLLIEPKRVRSRFLNEHNWIAWQGFRGRVHLQDEEYSLEIGWKIFPDDVHGLKSDDARKYGVGFGVRVERLNQQPTPDDCDC